MSVSPDSLELPIESRSSSATPGENTDLSWLGLAAATVVAIIVTATAFSGLVLTLSIAAVTIVVLIGAKQIQESVPAADTIVLVGRSPMALVISSSFDTNVNRKQKGRKILSAQTIAEAASMVRSVRCDQVILAGDISVGSLPFIDARARTPKIVSGPEKIEAMLGRVPLEFVAHDEMLTNFGTTRALDRSYERVKRALDLMVCFVLGFVILPVFPFVALAIKLDSRGPVFYSQRRVGLGGKVFRIYKFRTMRQDAERLGAVWAEEKDPRVTRVGWFMRRTRIDELPQLWNVVRGEMSFVGPRPERPEFTSQLAEEFDGYDKRQSVKPGLTGWAQVCFRYTNSVKDSRVKVEYDLYYIKHANLLLDFKILARTAGVVLRMRGL